MTWLYRLPVVLRLPAACLIVFLGCVALAVIIAMLPAILLVRAIRNRWRMGQVIRAIKKGQK